MLAIIENEIYKYSLQLKSYYDSSGRLTQYPSRKPLQCMVLKNFADSLSINTIYSKAELNDRIEQLAFMSKENIINDMLSFGFIKNDEKSRGYYLDPDCEKHYMSFLGLV